MKGLLIKRIFMNKNRYLLFLLIFFAIQCLQAQKSMSNKGWEAFMHRQALHWDSISTNYYTGIILGNGLMGTNIYKENESAIRFDIGRTDVTDQQPHIDVLWTEQLLTHPRLPIGKMLLLTQGFITSANMQLDVYNAMAIGTVTTTKGTINFKALVPTANENIIYIEATTTGMEKTN